nr:ABC transporter permease [Escherichia coli]
MPVLRQGGRVGLGLVLALALPLALAVGGEIAVDTGVASGRLLPPPSRIGATVWELAASGDLLVHVEATLIRVGLGFLFGAAAGILM